MSSQMIAVGERGPRDVGVLVAIVFEGRFPEVSLKGRVGEPATLFVEAFNAVELNGVDALFGRFSGRLNDTRDLFDGDRK